MEEIHVRSGNPYSLLTDPTSYRGIFYLFELFDRKNSSSRGIERGGGSLRPLAFTQKRCSGGGSMSPLSPLSLAQ